MNKFIIACLLGSLLSVTTVYAGRYDNDRNDDDKRERPVRNEPPRPAEQSNQQAQPDKKWRPVLQNEPPRNEARQDEREQRRDDREVRRDERRNDQPQGRDERNNRRDDRSQWRDDRNNRRDDRPQWRDERNDRRDDRHHRRDERRDWHGDRSQRPDWRPVVRHHPRYGNVVPRLPHGFVHFILHTSDYYYYDGIFYRPHQTGYIIIDAPIGAILTELPRPFEMLLVDGVPYYEAYGSYFVDDPSGFRVVPNPFQIVQPDPATNSTELFIYPARGQGQEQQSIDRYECHRWGVSQTGFDPSTAQIPNDARLPDYRRAMSACLEARGYTVK